jgi:very-short-patch-repair endonuclease
VERTLIDLARDPGLERALEQAYALRLIGRTRMAEALDRAKGRAGVSELRKRMSRLIDDLPLTRSELERRFLTLVAEHALPAPEVNRRKASHRVDFLWRERDLIVETDGRATHDNPYAFPEDRKRDLDLELADVHVLRFSWWQITDDAERVARLLRRRLTPA